MTTNAHMEQPIYLVGSPLEEARAVVVMIHGRGASAQDILSLLTGLARVPEGVTFLAPQAANHTWYPNSFLTPIPGNEPWLTHALERVDGMIGEVERQGIPAERVGLLGFSQGACLVSEYAVRHPRRYGGIVALSGGLIGPPGTQWPTEGDLAGTSAFFGCSDVDSHIPLERVEKSAEVLASLGAAVTKRIYPGMGHLVNEDELGWIEEWLAGLSGGE